MLNSTNIESTSDIATSATPLIRKAKASKPAAAKKKTKAKKPTVKKAAAKKVVAKKVSKTAQAQAPVEAEQAVVAKKSAKRKAKPAVKSLLYMEKTAYKALIQGLMDQGIDHADAVETIKVGLREANGIPVSKNLRMAANSEMQEAA